MLFLRLRKGQLYLIGDLNKKVDVTLEYFIKDFIGNELKIGEETIGVNKSLVIEREFPVPNSLESGDYLFYVKLTYLDNIATSANHFTVIKEHFLITFVKENYIILIVILVILILIKVFKTKKKYKISPLKIIYSLKELLSKIYLKETYTQGIAKLKYLLKNILGIIQNCLDKLYIFCLKIEHYVYKLFEEKKPIEKKRREFIKEFKVLSNDLKLKEDGKDVIYRGIVYNLYFDGLDIKGK